jgi:hypothetical protein
MQVASLSETSVDFPTDYNGFISQKIKTFRKYLFWYEFGSLKNTNAIEIHGTDTSAEFIPKRRSVRGMMRILRAATIVTPT